MSQITGGEVAYGRTIKTGDFENKRVDVKLAFNVGEGENHDDILNKAGQAAVNKAHELAGLKPVVAQVAPAMAPSAPAATDKDKLAAAVKAGEATTAQPVKPRVGRPPKVQVADKPADKAFDVVTEQPQDAVEEVGEDIDDLLGSAAVEITDKDIVDAITKKNGEIKNPTVIKKLIGEFAGPPPKRATDVPAEVRSQFLEKLAGLKAAV